jgi:PAS domain S-box-containing protein
VKYCLTSGKPPSPASDSMKPNDDIAIADITDLLLDAICVVNPQGYFVSITGAGERIFGYLPDEMIGKPMIDFVFHEDRARTLQAVDRVMAGHLQRHFENRYVRKDGTLVHILWSARWSDADQIRVAVARDITGQKQAGDTAGSGIDPLPQAVPCWRLSASPPRLTPPGFGPIPLSPQDYLVLLALATDGNGVSRDAIVVAMGGDCLDYDRRRLDTQMRRLRRKVEQACGLSLPVTTLRGVGYRFYDDIEVCR